MNKKTNTLIFILCATVFNIIIAIVSFIIFLLLYIRFIMPIIPETGQSWGFTLIFIASIAVSFMVYRWVIKYLMTKVEIEKYFDPLFVRKHKRISKD